MTSEGGEVWTSEGGQKCVSDSSSVECTTHITHISLFWSAAGPVEAVEHNHSSF